MWGPSPHKNARTSYISADPQAITRNPPFLVVASQLSVLVVTALLHRICCSPPCRRSDRGGQERNGSKQQHESGLVCFSFAVLLGNVLLKY